MKARSHGIFTHEDALATCSEGEKVCGVYHGSAAFECLNTDITLESCEWAPAYAFFGAHIPFLQVVDAWLQIHSSRRRKALRESTVLLFLTSRTSDVPRVIVLSSVVTTASFLPQIVASASMTDSLSSLFSFKLCRLSTGDEYVIPLGRYPYLDLNENGYISLVELCFVVASSP